MFKRKYLYLILLFGLGCLLSIIKIRSTGSGLLELSNNYDNSHIIASGSGVMVAGDVASGSFTSQYKNLGIIKIRFYNQDRDSDDTLLFRLKEKDQRGWYYEAKYKTDQFLPHEFFPIGFPVIKDSNGKNYEFFIESLEGTTKSGILIDYQTPTFKASSIYTKKELLSEREEFLYFIKNKISNILINFGALTSIIVYFLPLIFFVLYLIFSKSGYQILFYIFTTTVIWYVFWFLDNSSFYVFSTLFLWVMVVRGFNIESRVTYLFGLLCFFSIPVLVLLGMDVQAEKLSIYVFLFFALAVSQKIMEVTDNYKILFTLKPFFKQIKNIKYEKVPGYKRYFTNVRKIVTLENFTKNLKNFNLNKAPWPLNNPLFVGTVLPVLVFTWLVLKNFILIYLKYFVFISFFPENYLTRFTSTLLVPILILIFLLSLLYFSLKNTIKIRYLIAIVILAFYGLSGIIISKAVRFENLPRIISVSPSVTNEAWTDIVVSGKNFRNVPFIGKILIDDVEQGEYMVYWSDEKIIFRTSPNLTKSGQIQVIPLDRDPSNKVPFTYTFR